MRKDRIKSPCLVRVYLLNLLSFCEGKTRFTHVIAANKRANSHNFKIKKFEFTHNYFPRRLLNEQR